MHWTVQQVDGDAVDLQAAAARAHGSLQVGRKQPRHGAGRNLVIKMVFADDDNKRPQQLLRTGDSCLMLYI